MVDIAGPPGADGPQGSRKSHYRSGGTYRCADGTVENPITSAATTAEPMSMTKPQEM